MNIDSIVEGACARATVEFCHNVELEIERLHSPEGGGWNIAIAEARATRRFLPDMVKSALLFAFSDFEQELLQRQKSL